MLVNGLTHENVAVQRCEKVGCIPPSPHLRHTGVTVGVQHSNLISVWTNGTGKHEAGAVLSCS